jgi:hypothetical protein
MQPFTAPVRALRSVDVSTWRPISNSPNAGAASDTFATRRSAASERNASQPPRALTGAGAYSCTTSWPSGAWLGSIAVKIARQ